MTTTRTRQRQIEREDIDLMRGDTDEDFLAYGDNDEDTILASTGNAITRTQRTQPTATTRTQRTHI